MRDHGAADIAQIKDRFEIAPSRIAHEDELGVEVAQMSAKGRPPRPDLDRVPELMPLGPSGFALRCAFAALAHGQRPLARAAVGIKFDRGDERANVLHVADVPDHGNADRLDETRQARRKIDPVDDMDDVGTKAAQLRHRA